MNQFEAFDPMGDRENTPIPQHIDKPLETGEEEEAIYDFESLESLFENVERDFPNKTDEEKEMALTQLSMRLGDLGRNITMLQKEGEQIDLVEKQQNLHEEISGFVKEHAQ